MLLEVLQAKATAGTFYILSPAKPIFRFNIFRRLASQSRTIQLLRLASIADLFSSIHRNRMINVYTWTSCSHEHIRSHIFCSCTYMYLEFTSIPQTSTYTLHTRKRWFAYSLVHTQIYSHTCTNTHVHI